MVQLADLAEYLIQVIGQCMDTDHCMLNKITLFNLLLKELSANNQQLIYTALLELNYADVTNDTSIYQKYCKNLDWLNMLELTDDNDIVISFSCDSSDISDYEQKAAENILHDFAESLMTSLSEKLMPQKSAAAVVVTQDSSDDDNEFHPFIAQVMDGNYKF